jgi:hypothetical protein
MFMHMYAFLLCLVFYIPFLSSFLKMALTGVFSDVRLLDALKPASDTQVYQWWNPLLSGETLLRCILMHKRHKELISFPRATSCNDLSR